MRSGPLSILVLLGAPAVLQAATPTAYSYAKLPLAFERQEEGPQERYVARGNGYMIALQNGSATIGVQPQAGTSGIISMAFVGARKVSGTAGPELPGKVNHLHGNDPRHWRFGLPTYGNVSYREIYPGIEVVYRGNQRQMEFDLVLKPGADPKRIRLRFDGAREVSVDPNGTLTVHCEAGDLHIPLPVVYQEVARARMTVRGSYALLANREVGFRLDGYDRGKPLVIDPTIAYASLIGGGTSTTVAQGIAMDSDGDSYIAGYTYASDYPTINAAFSLAHSLPDGFVSKIDPTGTTLLYSTYIGGGSYDYLDSIAVDSTGAAWVAGYTESVDFPVLNAYQAVFNTSGNNGVVVKLSPSGALLYSTYFGSGTYGQSIAVDANLNAYVAGGGNGTVPTTPGAYLTSPAGGNDGFVAKFNTTGGLVYSTYVGGTSTDYIRGVAVDGLGNAYVTGYSYSQTFANAPPGGAQPANAGGGDAFVAQLNPAGSALGYFTFLGGSQLDYGEAIAVDAGGNAYVAGYTSSTNFPVTEGAFQTVPGGGTDGFVAKLNSNASAFTYVTYLGGSRQDYVQGLAIDGSGDAFVTGQTDSAQFPTVAAIEGGLSGNSVSLFETNDSGSSWTSFDNNIPGAVYSISPDPTPGAVAVATEAGIYRTVNSGQSWTQTSTLNDANLSRSLASSSTIYAMVCCSSAYRSADGGMTWNYQGSIGNQTTQIVADPTNVNTAYAYYEYGSYPLKKTVDGGVTWNPATTGLPSSPYIYSMVAGSDGSLYVDVSGYGVYKSTNQGTSWAAVNSGLGSLSGAQNGLAISASNPSVLYRSNYGNVIYTTTNGGTTWAPVPGTAPAPLSALAVSATNPSLIYAVASGYPTLYESPDGGTTWNPAGTGLGFTTPTQIVADPTSASGAYALASVLSSAFVAQINPSGSGLIYSTYLGGSEYTYGYGVAQYGGDAFVTGYSYGTFPVTTALQGSQTSYEAFVVHISGATANCSFSVSPLAQTVYSSAATLSYSVVAPSGCAWTAVSNQPWAIIGFGASGSGTGVASLALLANTTGAVRTATLTIGGQGVSLTQAPSSCSYSLNPSSPSLGAVGGIVETTVTAAAGCPWTVVNNYPFAVSVSSGASGTGNGTVVLNVSPTAQQTSRSLSIQIGNASLRISQAGYCNYVLSPPGILLSGTGGSGSVTVTTQNGCAWTAYSENTSWLTITSGSSGTGRGAVNYTAVANTGANENTYLYIAGTYVPVTETLGQAYLISTLVGGFPEPPTSASTASVSIANSFGVAVDSSGNVYFPSPNLNAVFKTDTSGVVTRIAGTGAAGYSGDSGPALGAQLNNPNGVAVDALGNIFISDRFNYLIRKVSTNGTITTVAGNGTCCYSGDGGLATSAQINDPQGIAVDSLGNLYVTDTDNQRIRKVDTSGVITTLAGNGSCCYSGDSGPATSAQLNYPKGSAAVDSLGNVYFSDSNNRRIRQISTNGVINTVAGNGNCCFSGDGGLATDAQIAFPQGVAIDSLGNLYVADSSNNRIRQIALSGIINTVGGMAMSGYAGDGGPATSAELNNPQGVAVDGGGNLYISDNASSRIRKITAAGIITTVEGGGIGDGGLAAFGSLNQPLGVVRDGVGNTYIADTYNHKVRKIAANGTITTVAGTGVSGYSGDGAAGASAALNFPHGVAVDSNGNLYVADSQNRVVRKVATNGTITTAAGNGNCCYSGDGGPATSAQLNYPTAVALDGFGNLYISDANSPSIRKVALNGIITTVAGNGNCCYSGDGGPATSAQINSPQGLTVDASGNLYIADSNNQRIRKVALNGTITTVAGNGKCCFSGDGGPATSAQFNYPVGVAVDAAGNLYITDDNSQRVRKVDLNGIITSIAGTGGYNWTGDGGFALNANFRNPTGLFVDTAGNVYTADQNNNALRLLTPIGTQPVLSIQSTHTGNFTQGQSGAAYTVTVSNALAAGSTNGTVTVTAILPAGLTLVNMTGTGWQCGSGSCSPSDALSGGSSYPAITVTVNVAANAPTQVTNQATVSGGGAQFAGTEDLTVIAPSSAPLAPVLISPVNGASGVSLAPTLAWNASAGATSYDVAFGTAATPPMVANTADINYSPGSLASGATYYWSVAARNSVGANTSGISSFTVNCVSPLSSTGASVSAISGTGSVPVTAPNGCGWTAQSNATWLAITSGSPGNGNGTVNYSVAANPGLLREGTLTVAGQTYTVTQTASLFATESYLISTIAGGAIPPTVAAGTSISLPLSYGVAVDSSGNVYFPSPNLNAVFQATPSGIVTRIAGTGIAGYSGDNAPALSAKLSNPNGVAVDSLGNVYIADTGNVRIRKVATSGIITTVAGNGNCCYSGDGGLAISAQVNYPQAVTVDALGNLYIADNNNYRIRKVATNGIITTLAGNGTCCYSGDNGPATSAQLNNSHGMAVDPLGNLYFADTNNQRIRRVDTRGIVTTFAGSNVCCNLNEGGAATGAWIAYPEGVALDGSGNLYIASNHSVRMVSPAGIIATVSGTYDSGFGGDGGSATGGQFNSPEGVALDSGGNLYISDTGNVRIRKISGGTLTTFVGGVTGDGGSGVFGSLNQPMGVVNDNAGNTYIADTNNNRIRKVAVDGAIATVAGTGTPGYSGDGFAATSAKLNQPHGLALDSAGNLYVADSQNHVVRKISINGAITTVAGNGNCCYGGDGAAATIAQLNFPTGVALDGSGNVYIADANSPSVRKVALNGVISTIAGNGTYGYFGDGGPATLAQLNSPQGLTLDGSGNVYIADSSNQRIRKVAANGTITTVAGNGNCCYSGDGGPATSAQVNYPTGVAFDAAGYWYIADRNNNRIRKVDLNGNISTIGGNGGYGYSGDGGPAGGANLRNAAGVFVDAFANVYVADQNNNAVRLLTPTGTTSLLAIQSTHTGAFTQGQSGAVYNLTVTNTLGAGPTAGTVTVTEILPNSLSPAMSGTGWTCGGTTCTRNDSLNGGSAYPPITVTVNVAANAPTEVTNQATVSGGGGPVAGAEDLTVIDGTAPVLVIASEQTSNFSQGQANATYALLVTNLPTAGATSGTVTVTESVPTGLTIVSMSGSGWSCPTLPTCTRNDSLNPGASYPPIAVTVGVSSNAPSSLTNQAMASGGGSGNANANDVTPILPSNTCDLKQTGTVNVADVQLMINQALGATSAANDLNGDGAVNVADVQIVINAALTLGCTVK